MQMTGRKKRYLILDTPEGKIAIKFGLFCFVLSLAKPSKFNFKKHVKPKVFWE